MPGQGEGWDSTCWTFAKHRKVGARHTPKLSYLAPCCATEKSCNNNYYRTSRAGSAENNSKIEC
jgi:hypothetical protein